MSKVNFRTNRGFVYLPDGCFFRIGNTLYLKTREVNEKGKHDFLTDNNAYNFSTNEFERIDGATKIIEVSSNSIRVEVDEMEMWTISDRKILTHNHKKVKHFFQKNYTK